MNAVADNTTEARLSHRLCLYHKKHQAPSYTAGRHSPRTELDGTLCKQVLMTAFIRIRKQIRKFCITLWCDGWRTKVYFYFHSRPVHTACPCFYLRPAVWNSLWSSSLSENKEASIETTTGNIFYTPRKVLVNSQHICTLFLDGTSLMRLCIGFVTKTPA